LIGEGLQRPDLNRNIRVPSLLVQKLQIIYHHHSSPRGRRQSVDDVIGTDIIGAIEFEPVAEE
jgi:hypothetical protein